MQNRLLSKGIVVVIIILFVGTSIVSSYTNQKEENILFLPNQNENVISNDWWNTSWLFRKQITIDNNLVDGDLENFPVLIANTSSNFSDHAQPDGDDFVFVDSSNTVQYNHELEFFDDETGELIVWVNVTELSSSEDTVLWIYYGNSDCENQENIQGTWDSYYVGVWHMNELSGDIKDSTGTQDGAVVGSPNYQWSEDVIFRSIYFDGSNVEYFVITNDVYKFYNEDVTLEVWGYYLAHRSWIEMPLCMGDTDVWPSMAIYKRATQGNYPGHISTIDFFAVHGGERNEAISNTGGTSHVGHWIYQVGRFERFEETSLYLNATKQDYTDTCEINDLTGGSTFVARIGRSLATTSGNPNSMRGYLDEVRISKGIARSETWIKTSYNNINDTENFITVSNVEFGVPIADFTYSIYGLEVAFNASSSYDPNGEIISYYWDFGDETNGTDMIVDHDYSDVGTYDVTLTVKDNDGFESDVTKSIVLTNQPPDAPVINGPNSGKSGQRYSYNFVAKDPNGDDVYYEIQWGDGDLTPWDGPHESDVIITKDHSWDEQGTFKIMARAKDSYGLIGEWGTLDITMPKNKILIFNFPLLNWLFERFPNVFSILRYLAKP